MPEATYLVTDHHEPAIGETATATFSADRCYRYLLTRTWDADRAATVWIMCNPSTADAFTEDPTVRRCLGFSRAWGAGGIIVANLFALRATQPRDLYTHAAPEGPDNDMVIAQVLGGSALAGPVVAAWGVHGHHRDRAAAVLALLAARGAEPMCLGTTKRGHPRHPLYVPHDTPLAPHHARANGPTSGPTRRPT